MKLGTTAIGTLKLGASQVAKAHLGAVEVWSSAFDPLTLSPAIWLDASDASTLWDATSGGSNSGSGGEVKRIDDKSGNGRHFTEATNAPIRSIAAINGLDAIALSSTKVLTRTGGSFSRTDFDNFFLVTKIIDSTYITVGTTSSAYFADASGNVGASTNAGFTAGEIRVNGIGINNSRISLHTARGVNTSLVTHTNITNQSVANWDSPRIGYMTTTNVYNVESGYFCELLVFANTMSTTDRDAVEAYLNAKYAIY